MRMATESAPRPGGETIEMAEAGLCDKTPPVGAQVPNRRLSSSTACRPLSWIVTRAVVRARIDVEHLLAPGLDDHDLTLLATRLARGRCGALLGDRAGLALLSC